ncbi:RHS repeat-associated protein [Thiogranum longum]|uniref:RHS repeat-associated protein n=1 Tax=Thiogranum longum TaxID=1537524 RepID=A0A4R1HNN8_9GAMM|nr:RHS repeat-associated core domain-containing protein [Thiogranum longum]TCK18882.1 RHS repeat-associated protein [Thiogranum longum]
MQNYKSDTLLNKQPRHKLLSIALGICLSFTLWVLQIEPSGWISVVGVATADDFGGSGSPGAGLPTQPTASQPPLQNGAGDENKDDAAEKDEGNTECKGMKGAEGGPISLYDGAERFRRLDVVVNGLYPIRLERRYDSRATYDSTLGYGWSFNFDQRLFEYPDNSIVIRYNCGRKDRFVLTGNAYQGETGTLLGTLQGLPNGAFVFEHQDAVKDYYDAQGRLTAKENRDGHRLVMTYNPAGKMPLTGTSPYAVDPTQPMVVGYHYQLTKVEEQTVDGTLTGNALTFTYDVNTGRVATVTDNNSRQIGYVHDVTTGGLTIGNLTQVNGLESHTSAYIYDDRDAQSNLQDLHNITTVQEGSAAIPYVMTYDVEDRIATQTHGNTLRVITYVINNQQTQVTKTVTDSAGLNPYNVLTEYWFDPVSRRTSRFEDGMGNWFEYDYDAAGFPDVTRIYHNQGTKAVPARVLQKTIDYTYDSLGNRTAEVVTLDSGEIITKTWSYDTGKLSSTSVISSLDPKVFQTDFTFYRDGNNLPTTIKEIKRLKDDGVSYQTTTYTYDTLNRSATIVYPDGHKRVLLYENGSQFVTKIYHEISGAESPFDITRYGYDAKGSISDIWDANNNRTQFEYDNRLRLTKQTNALLEETIYTYANDRLQQIEVGRTVADGEGQIVKLNYNANNRLANLQRKDDSAQFITIESYTYDSEGRKTTQTDGENKTWTYAYDEAGNLKTVTDPLLNITSYTYDATNHSISIIDANSNETRNTYDDIGRIIQRDELGITPNIQTLFGYDAADNLISVTDGELNTTSYSYDSLSRKTRETRPLLQSIQYFYDDRDRLDYLLNARGQKIDYTYNEWGPVNDIKYYADNVTTAVDRTITYQYYNTGNIQNITDTYLGSTPLYSYTYDALNRADVTSLLLYPGGTITLDDDYDRYGNRDAFTLIDSGGTYAHQYTRNKLNHLVSVVLPGTQTFSSIDYDKNDRLKQLVTPSGLTTNILFADNGPVRDISINDGVPTLEQWVYTHDNVRNVDTMTDASGLHDYGYDNVNRLTSATHPAGLGIPTAESFGYDKAGNREDPIDALLYDYDANNRMLTSPGVTSYSFDADGNPITTSSGEVFNYDHDNRLAGYSNPGNSTTASYQYDPQGRRINKTVNGITTWYLWDRTSLMMEYSNIGSQQTRYAYLPNQFTPIQMQDANGIYDVHSDNLDTPKFLTNSSKQTVWKADNESFGKASVNDDVDGDTNIVAFNMRFPGQYFDSETGLHYNLQRYYSPDTGRYLTSDPIGLDGGLNSYLYVDANPVQYIDPLGLYKWTGTIIEGEFIVGIGSGGALIDVESECVNGKKAFVKATGVGPGLGVGIKGSPKKIPGGEGGDIEFDDFNFVGDIDPSVFNGTFGSVGAGLVIGIGYSASKIQCGSAYANDSGFTFGLNLGASGVMGTCTVIEYKIEDCDDCQK